MKIDESVIAKVLDNKASPEEARKVAGWFATEEGNKYLSERFDWEIGMLSEEMSESIDPHSIPEVKMKFPSLMNGCVKPDARLVNNSAM